MKTFDAVIFTDMSSKIWHVRPLGAYRLASELRYHGYSVLVVDFLSKWLNQRKQFLLLLKKILSHNTLFVGYSGTFFSTDNQIKRTLEGHRDYFGLVGITNWPTTTENMRIVNNCIKTLAPEAKIFYGGAQANTINNKLEDSGIDYVVQGFADGLIVDLLDRLKEKRTIQYDLNLSKKIKIINHDLLAKNFNFPESITSFHESDFIQSTEVLPLETSRGCLFKCKFCAFPLLGRKKGDPEYHKHISRLTNELVSNYKNFGVTKYTIIDDTFNETTDKLKEIYKSITDSQIKIEFSCYLRLDLLERYPEQISLLYKMGLRSCFLGIESLNPNSARSIGKSSSIPAVKKTLSLIKEVWKEDVSVFCSFIAGLPNDDEESINEWMNWVYDNENLIDSFVLVPLAFSQKSLWPSEIGKEPEKFGYQFENQTWTNNMGLTQSRAKDICNQWMEKSWNTSRLKIAGWEMMGIQNLGYSSEELRKYTLDQLPIDDFATRYIDRFTTYRNNLLAYVD